jgi:hypothetical protein
MAAMRGAIALQGPHQVAKQSRRTRDEEEPSTTDCLKEVELWRGLTP